MRFLILGATGPSGIQVVRKTLELYQEAAIVIYARSPKKLPEDLREHAAITIIQGTLEELDKVETIFQQHVDAVLSALGPVIGLGSPAGTPIADFYGHLIDLLVKHNVKRLILLATPSSIDPNDKPGLRDKLLVRTVRMLFNSAYSEVVAIGDVVRGRADQLDWTIVRVPYLTNEDSEVVVAGYVGDGKTGFTLSRKAYAAFTVGEVEKREWVQKAPAISNA